VKTPTANLILHEPELYIDRGTAGCALKMQFVTERARRLQEIDLENIASGVNLVGYEMPSSDIREAYAAL
jgi:hypothetical protein